MNRITGLCIGFAALFLAGPVSAAVVPAGTSDLAVAGASLVEPVMRRGAVARGPRGGVAVRRGGVARPPMAGRPGYGPRRPVVVAPRRPVVVAPRRGVWVRPSAYWWRPGAAVAAGAAIGFVTASTAARWAGSPPAPGYCWYYTDPSRQQGFWDACP